MSRLGDLLLTERLRRSLTRKQVAKLGGVNEKYIKDVEEGKRIIADDQARRILKKMGLTEQNEVGFSLDDIAATVDLETVVPSKAVASTNKVEKNETTSQNTQGIWLDALSSVLKRVPVKNAVDKEIDHRLLPILDGKIEGASPDKVFYFKAPDNSMRGFRIVQDDLCFIVPASSPIDDAIMLVSIKGHRQLRKVKKLDALNLLLQSFDHSYEQVHCALPDVQILGRVLQVTFSV